MATGDKDGHGLETCQVLILCSQKSLKKSMMVSVSRLIFFLRISSSYSTGAFCVWV